ncbi:inosine-uridine preferring nucleoside hydrolase [Haloactinopolyspora alba]|uniref:Inosine-uridine preferring nucleoside hydrolase n=1 Tax=Haloactinopolyspora alba TaxID=648780 RepID=A0A2P8E8R3_9ACTN|nr:nucleoside hydrolase [Haloactinopolyspora alba]PSL05853.1 inosine-uridine preferring nucleoside hydrolase [Haloactinopolyspora alba]
MSVPVVTVTDLYHPPEDPGDNVDLIMGYGLDEVDLRAVILDALDEKRHLVDGGVPGYPGPRDPGIVPVTQLNAVYGHNVPFATSPFTRMRTPYDTMTEVPAFQQAGIDLLLDTLQRSDEKVHVLSFGSARPIAVAYNREPELVAAKVARVHLCGGTSTPTYLEWNVLQDPQAMIRLVSTDLPIALYPCATEESCYAHDRHNTFYRLHDMRWIEGMHPALRRYLGYALGRLTRPDYLRVLDEDLPDEVMEPVYARSHDVWETAVWVSVTGRRIVRRPDGTHRIVRGDDVGPGDVEIRNEQLPCRAWPHESGLYSFEPTDEPTPTSVFVRDDPAEYERAMNEATPALFQSFRPPEPWHGDVRTDDREMTR